MKGPIRTFREEAEGYEISIRFSSLEAANAAVESLIDFLLAGAWKSPPAKQEAPPKEAKAPGNLLGVAELLVTYRQVRGMSQGDLARLIGCTQSAVSSWEGGRTVPTGIRMSKIQELLSCSEDGE